MSPCRAERRRDGKADRVFHAPGDLLITPADGSTARSLVEDEADQLYLTLDPALVEGVAGEIGADVDGRVELWDTLWACDPQVGRIGLSLEAELRGAGGVVAGGKLYAESLVNALIVHLLREYSSLGRAARQKAFREPRGGLSRHALKRALDYIGDNLSTGGLSLAGIAGAAGLSPNHFSKLFKQSTGLSPHRYVIRERTEKAKALLAGTGLPVGVVDRDCGFSDQAHLTRHFKRVVGITPTRFRR